MFTVTFGDKFITGMVYGNIQTSARPKFFKTQSEVDKFTKAIMAEGTRLVSRYTEYADAEQKKVDKANKDMVRLTAKMAELVELPYKDAVKKVASTKKSMENAQRYIKGNSIKSYRQSASRLQKILDRLQVVKVESVDVLAQMVV